MRRAPSGLVRAGGGASRSRPRRARRPRTSAVVRRRDGQPARRVRRARPTSSRAWPCSSPPARGEPSCRGDSWPKPWVGSPLPSTGARRSRRCGHVPCSPRRCCTSVVATSSRWWAWPRAITEASQGLGDDAMAIALDQESIFMLMAHDWPSAKRRSTAALAQAGSQPAIAVGTRHFAAVLALALGEVDDARALLHEAGAALDRVPDASSPFFTTLTVSWIVDDRGPVPLPVAEDTMLLGRRRRRRPGARAPGGGRRPHRAPRRPDGSRARAPRRRHRPVHRGGRHLRHRLHARPARTHAPVGRRPGGCARLLRRRRAGPPILARSALHRHGSRRAVLRRRPAGGGDDRPPPRRRKRCR